MPAITVGVAEVEERLRRLRRRLNSRTALHVGSIGLSIVLLVAAALLLLALRGSPLLFRVAVWSGLVVVVSTVSTCVVVTRRRWMSLKTQIRPTRLAQVALAIGLLTFAACNGTSGKARRGETDMSPYVPQAQEPFVEAQLAALRVPLPQIGEAEYVNDDELCMTCHQAYTASHKTNVHRGQSCGKCHGPASRHLETRGKEPGTILSLKSLTPPQKSEVCMQCHEQDACAPGSQWRTSKHAHNGVSCTDCHTQYYNVPPGTPPTQVVTMQKQ